MDSKIRAWLDEIVDVHRRFDSPISMTRLQRIAELVDVNQGLCVSSWGIISSGGTYGRIGLEQAEAFDLMRIEGVLYGFRILQPDCMNEIYDVLRMEIERVRAITSQTSTS